jgi:beta-glucanase (GH16 family)
MMKTVLGLILTFLAGLVLLPLTWLAPSGTQSTSPALQLASTCPPFLDDLDSYDTARWHKADGWANGDPFANGWRADHVIFSGEMMNLRLDDESCPAGCSTKAYASGEYRSNGFFGYGRVEGRFKAAKNSGIVTSLFTYTGPSDGHPHDEIDIEILGKDTTKMQVNYYTNGVGSHEEMIDLGFDASTGFHTYAFEWSSVAITWYVDGTAVHTATDSIPSTPGRIMMNLWPGTGVDDWLGPFNYTGSLTATYDWVKYTPASCVYLPIILKG